MAFATNLKFVNTDPPNANGKIYDLAMRFLQPYFDARKFFDVDNCYM